MLKHLQEGEYQTNERAIGYNSNENKCVFFSSCKTEVIKNTSQKVNGNHGEQNQKYTNNSLTKGNVLY